MLLTAPWICSASGARDRDELQRKYGVALQDTTPRVFWRLTDNWLELTVRFLTPEHGVRAIKDAMARRILDAFDAARIEVASATFEIVAVPPLHVRRTVPDGERA